MIKLSLKQQFFRTCLFCLAFFIYSSLGGIIIYLPPLLGILFVAFIKNYEMDNEFKVWGIIACLFIFEINNNLPLGVLALSFLILRFFFLKTFYIISTNEIVAIGMLVGGIYLWYFLVIYSFKTFGGGARFSLNLVFVYYIIFETILGILYSKINRKIA